MTSGVGQSQMTLTSETESFKNPPWWNRRTRLERSLLFLTITALLMISVMAVALAVFGYMHQRNMSSRQAIYLPSTHGRLVSESSSKKVCLTPGCVKAAAQILNNLDEKADPCVDFYQFACGGWEDRHTIPEDRSSVSVFSDSQDDLNIKLRVLLEKSTTGKEPDFVKMVKTMYNSCLDVKTIDTLKEDPLKLALDAVGGWPVVVGDKWDESKFNWIDMLIKFRKMGYSHDILMDLSVTADYRNNTNHILDLDQPLLGMPDRSYFLRGFNDSVTSAYFNLMIKVATKLGADKEVAVKELTEAFRFEAQLANFSLPREERRNISQLYNKYTVEKLQELAPKIDWLKYFNGLLNNQITEDEPIVVTVPTFIKKFSKLIETTKKRTVANYLVWRMAAMSISLLSKDWRNIAQEYTAALTGKSQEEPRWEQCLTSLTGTLAVALGSYYVRHHFREESRDAAMEMVEYIHKEFLHILDKVDWMESETRTQAIEKAKSITPYIGYPKELRNDSAVSDLYANLTLSEKSYFDNILNVKKFATDYAFNQLRKPNIKGEWKKHARAAVVNAYYNALENSIEFPAGILQGSFFSKDRPHYLNFGAIGFVIGHEITHGFDDKGRQFDKDGNNKNWWDAKTDEHYKKKAQCMINQYSNYTVTEVDMNVNGINTQGENIADNGGIKEAYKAYHAWVVDNEEEPSLPGLKYTPGQLFWISAANVWCGKYRPASLKLRILTGAHSPPKFRVIGPFSNAPEFAKDFHCHLGSRMNPKSKCQVW